jgi:hypothetical protein
MTADEELKEVLEATEAWIKALIRATIAEVEVAKNQTSGHHIIHQYPMEYELMAMREHLIQKMIALSKATV